MASIYKLQRHCNGAKPNLQIIQRTQREMSPEVEEDGVEAAVCEQRRCAVGEQEQLSDEGLARAQKPRSSGKSPASVPEAGGRLVPVSAMALVPVSSMGGPVPAAREHCRGPPWPIPRARGRRERGSGSGNADQSGGGWGETVKSEWVMVTRLTLSCGKEKLDVAEVIGQ
ncbi:unnamed protein product [Miscanthus lutarioriparius]|uniref:Uncharacterized protein n=1 Tax=Miscanthus lutarioriparius TaxID=422564 RepID=A0A811MW47_9POAL|nr:unnamed protein product [Miscanthus lutarioriparius]